MNSSDKANTWGLAIIFVWALLMAGDPDLLDAISDRVSGRSACMVVE